MANRLSTLCVLLALLLGVDGLFQIGSLSCPAEKTPPHWSQLAAESPTPSQADSRVSQRDDHSTPALCDAQDHFPLNACCVALFGSDQGPVICSRRGATLQAKAVRLNA